MNKAFESAFDRIFTCGLVPVIKLDSPDTAVPLCRALFDGGIDVAEITFRTDAAEESIKRVYAELPEVYVGAGTVSNVETAKKAIAAGAKFIISPGSNAGVIAYCVENGIPVFPGVSSATDIETCIGYGLKTVKFFPAETSGGIAAIKALSGPYPNLTFMPTGGIGEQNLLDYLNFGKIAACGGSWMVKDDLVKAGDFAAITELTKRAVLKMHNFRFAHMAINTDSNADAVGLAGVFDSIFATGARETSAGAFAGDFIETIGNRNIGEHGHIAFRTTNVKRAIAYLKRIGIQIDESSIKGPENAPTLAYLQESYGGFKVHIVQ